jgi:hypothetical protein
MLPMTNLANQNIPDWARWKAQDADGTWWAFEVEPLQFHKGWYENEVGRFQRLFSDKPSEDWKHTLSRLDHTDSDHTHK